MPLYLPPGSPYDLDWIEVTTGGATVDPNNRVESFERVGDAWALDWLGGISALAEGFDEGPHKDVALSEYAPRDFDFGSWGVELLLRAEYSDPGLNPGAGTPYGLGAMLGLRSATAAYGAFIRTNTASNSVIGDLGDLNVVGIWSNTNPWSALRVQLSRFGATRFLVTYSYWHNGTTVLAPTALTSVDSTIQAESLEDLSLTFGGTVQTAAETIAFRQYFRAYVAFPRIQEIPPTVAGLPSST